MKKKKSLTFLQALSILDMFYSLARKDYCKFEMHWRKRRVPLQIYLHVDTCSHHILKRKAMKIQIETFTKTFVFELKRVTMLYKPSMTPVCSMDAIQSIWYIKIFLFFLLKLPTKLKSFQQFITIMINC